MGEVFRKKLTGAAKTGRRVAIAAAAGAIALGSINYTQAAGVGIETIFDEYYYADKYPDLKEAFGYDREALLEHFMTFGLSEGSHTLTIVLYDGKTLTADFTV